MTDGARAAYQMAASAYEAAKLIEKENTIVSVTGESEHVPVNANKTDKPTAMDEANTKHLYDGIVTAYDNVGDSTFTRGDHCIFTNKNEKLNLTFTFSENETFSGIRFYARKSDWETGFVGNSRPNTVRIKLYGDDDETYVTSGIITTDPSNDGRYVNIMLGFNGNNVTVSGVKKMDISIISLRGNYNHWGSEEVRLLTDTTISKTSTLADIAEASVTSKEIVADTGVLNDKGIIRFITEFEKIADGTEIEYFGTYVIKDGAYDETKVKKDSDNVGVYYVSDANIGRQPVVGETFSVDVMNIDSDKYETGVTAVSFVKIAGYENPIILNVKQGVTVNGERNVKLPATETTTETAGTTTED